MLGGGPSHSKRTRIEGSIGKNDSNREMLLCAKLNAYDVVRYCKNRHARANKSIFTTDCWASEASPTLGCSIEISRDIYIL